jgi:protein involved in polysaccharide export with SLBB domain
MTRHALRAFVALLLLCVTGAPQAANPVLTKEQLQLLQQLPPAEREAVLRSLQVKTPAPGLAPGAELPEAAATDQRLPVREPVVPLQPPRLKAADTIIIRFERPEPPPAPLPSPFSREKPSPEPMPDKELFVLDQFGAVTFDKVGRIVLKGLDETEAAERIAAEPAFRGLKVVVRLLPVEEPLKPFGYDLFAATPGRPVPPAEVAPPEDYIVGPGDTVLVQLFGKESTQHELPISREGKLLFPGIGPITVTGMTFRQLEREIHARVGKQLIGIKAAVTLGRLRGIRVFVLGEVERPGSYAVGGLSTLTNALLASGGVKRIGSLRDIQLKRKGRLVTRLDLYDLLLRGDNSADAHLQPADVIFVPPVGKTAGIAGRVRRPAIYELKDEKTLDELIAMAGGLAPDAFPQGVQIERIVGSRERTLLGVDLAQEGAGRAELQDGDVVRVYSIADRLKDVVKLAGHVHRPGEYQWRPQMRLTDLLPSLADLQQDADARYVLIRREDTLAQSVSFLDGNLLAALADPQSEANPQLQPQDEVHVFDIRGNRETVVRPLLDQARERSAPGRPVPEVTVEGLVHHPGPYPLSSGMRVADLLRAAGGLTDRAYTLEAELTRYAVVDGKEREQSRAVVDMDAVLKGDGAKNLGLNAYDRLVIRRIPKWDENGSVEIVGEVRFPGKYPIGRNEKLSEVLKRAGGFSEQAYPKGAIFLRESVRQREQEHLERLVRELERDLALVATEERDIGVKKEVALAQGQALLRQLRAAKAAGRMAIRLEPPEDQREVGEEIMMQPGDKLFIPRQPQEVTVLGEVYYPTSHLVDRSLGASDYVRLSGGVTEKGNSGAIYVVHANGSVSPAGGWFRSEPEIGPGDTIVVPLKVERVGTWQLTKDVTTILFQLAVTAAALDAIGVF